ncbi:MAG TPA: alpha/beta hydrolase family protein [Blastocatellia bacterium]|jgi:S-formylglutathione hydrolase FrmB|nr:alpha/beta hydrolase family protein [Blastocatellia bacterium]
MRKSLILFAIILLPLFARDALSQGSHGTVTESLSVESKILGKRVRYSIYLPYDYATSARNYPVVYLLHGYTDSDMAWIQFGEANLIADEAIADRTVPPMIIVMPDAGVSWYINNYDNSVKYEDFFIKEFIPHIETTFRARRDKQYRAVAGLSMGGYGALVYTLRHPDMFASCVAFSAAIFTDEEIMGVTDDVWARIDSVLYGPGLKGKERLTEHYKSYNPIHLVRGAGTEKLKNLRLYIDCGDDDFLYKGNATFHILLRDMKIPHEYRARDGGYTWSYWRSGLIDGLKFIGDGFHR